ncbi:MAG: hypothetical protein ACLTZM_02505 [Ruminococcus sp.]
MEETNIAVVDDEKITEICTNLSSAMDFIKKRLVKRGLRILEEKKNRPLVLLDVMMHRISFDVPLHQNECCSIIMVSAINAGYRQMLNINRSRRLRGKTIQSAGADGA